MKNENHKLMIPAWAVIIVLIGITASVIGAVYWQMEDLEKQVDEMGDNQSILIYDMELVKSALGIGQLTKK